MPDQPSASAAHRPMRYYGEHLDCTHPEDLPESMDDDAAGEYESAYYDTHFYVGEDDFETCEPAFSGYGCPACGDAREDFIEWEKCPHYDPATPLPEAQYDDPPTLPEGVTVDA